MAVQLNSHNPITFHNPIEGYGKVMLQSHPNDSFDRIVRLNGIEIEMKGYTATEDNSTE